MIHAETTRDSATDSTSGQLPEDAGATPAPATKPHPIHRQAALWIIFALGAIIAISTVGPFGMALWLILYINVVVRSVTRRGWL